MGREIKKQFEDYGIVFPLDFLIPSEVGVYKNFCDEIEEAMNFPELIDLTQLHLTYKTPYDLAINTKILDAVESIIGPNILIWSTSIFSKKGNSPDIIEWHQDAKYWGFDQPGKIVSAWVALTNSDTENGAMRVIPCSHKLPLLEHEENQNPANKLSRKQSIKNVPNNIHVSISLQPGSGSLHHSMLIHSSEPNKTDSKRIGFVIRYISPEISQSGVKTKVILARGEDNIGNFTIFRPKLHDVIDDNSKENHQNLCNEFLEDNKKAFAVYSKQNDEHSYKDYLKLYEIFRELIRSEVDWVKQRMTWLGTLEGLLLAGFGLIFKGNLENSFAFAKILMIMFCICGLITSVFLTTGIYAAGNVIREIVKDWNRLIPKEEQDKLPSLRFTSANTKRKILPKGRYSTVGISYVFIIAWSVLLFIIIFFT